MHRIYLEVESSNTAAIRLYEAQGFRSLDTLADYYGVGRSALHMLCETSNIPKLFDTDLRAA